MIGCLLFLLLALGVIAYAAGWRPQFGQWLQAGGMAVGSSSSRALEILRERYARGEVNLEEYQRMREDLQS